MYGGSVLNKRLQMSSYISRMRVVFRLFDISAALLLYCFLTYFYLDQNAVKIAAFPVSHVAILVILRLIVQPYFIYTFF